MTDAILAPVIKQRFFSNNGLPLANGKLYSYVAGSAGAANKDTYSSKNMAATNPNPVLLDANGYANVWLDPAGSYLFVLKDSANVTQWTVDNVKGEAGTDVAVAALIALLSANTGAGLIGTLSGDTLQISLNKISTRFDTKTDVSVTAALDDRVEIAENDINVLQATAITGNILGYATWAELAAAFPAYNNAVTYTKGDYVTNQDIWWEFINAVDTAGMVPPTLPATSNAYWSIKNPSPSGQLAQVPVTDLGTHTDPVVGGTVANTGVFRYSVAPVGFERIYDTDSVSAQPYAILASHYANDETDVPVPGQSNPAARGAKFWSLMASAASLMAGGYSDSALAYAQMAYGYSVAASSAGIITTGNAALVVIDSGGCTGTITWKGFKDGGTSSFTPDTSPKLLILVTDKSYDQNGSPSVRNRTIIGTVDDRQVYPAQASPVDTEDAFGCSRRVWFSEPVFARSNVGIGNVGLSPIASVIAGLYTDNGAGGTGLPSLASSLNVINISTRPYPVMVPNWACSARTRGGAAGFDFEIVADNQYGFNSCTFARAEVIVTDSAANTQMGYTNSLAASAQVTTTDPVSMVGKIHVNTTGLTDGAATARLKLYPHLGDTVWDSAVNGFTWPTPQVASIPVLIDVAGNYAPAYGALDTVGGNDGTAVVSLVQATAQASPFLTWAAMRTAQKAFNNARGHNNMAGAYSLIKQDIAGFGARQDIEAAGLTWWVVKNWSTVSPQTIGITDAGVGINKIIQSNMSFEGLFIRSTSNTYVLDGLIDGNIAGLPSVYSRFVNCKFSASATTNSTPLLYQIGLIDYIGCTFTNPGAADLSIFSINRTNTRLHLGTVHTTTDIVGRALNAWTVVGCSFQYVHYADPQISNPNVQSIDGGIVLNNKFLYVSSTMTFVQDRGCTLGRVFAQNVVELIVGIVPALWISGDGAIDPVNNFISRFNTVKGGRRNGWYNDSTPARVNKQGVTQFDLDEEWNIKRDPFNNPVYHQSGLRTGGWEVSHGCGCFGRHIITGSTGADVGGSTTIPGPNSWLGEYLGLASTVGVPVTFTSDKSFTGLGGGGGIYLPTGTIATLINKVAAGRAPYPLDIRNVARKNTGTGSCGAYEVG